MNWCVGMVMRSPCAGAASPRGKFLISLNTRRKSQHLHPSTPPSLPLCLRLLVSPRAFRQVWPLISSSHFRRHDRLRIHRPDISRMRGGLPLCSACPQVPVDKHPWGSILVQVPPSETMPDPYPATSCTYAEHNERPCFCPTPTSRMHLCTLISSPSHVLATIMPPCISRSSNHLIFFTCWYEG